MTLVLVAGTYPPIPRPAAAATVDAVRREWAEGRDVVVVSPRPSSAHYAAPILGPLAGRRLDNVRRKSGATRLVFCVEPGLPFTPAPGSPAARWRTARTAAGLARAMARFEHTTLVLTETGPADPATSAGLERLRRAATEIQEDPRPDPADATITVLGPVEVLWRDRAIRRGGQLGHAVFGTRWGPIRNRLAAEWHRLRAAVPCS